VRSGKVTIPERKGAMTAAAPPRPSKDAGEADGVHQDGSQRLDKWLWFARAIKSRTLAAGLVTEGKVRVNRERSTKPSQPLRPGDVVTITVRGDVRVLRMLLPGVRRGPPVEAQALYEDLTPVVPRPEKGDVTALNGERTHGSGRPTKRERRQMDRFKEGD
jgi:ribosome-associated heat shock protein Hsp15